MNAVLAASSLSCLRAERTLFSDLSFEIGPGEVLHVRGANGSGKSSLLRILCGLARPDSGEVRWNGATTETLGTEFSSRLLYLGHANALKSHLSAAENLEFLCGLMQGDAARIDSAIETCGLRGEARLAAGSLSAGQRRRLALARVLLCDASLWVLDEPFASMDADGRRLFTRLLNEHVESGGLAVIAGHDAIELSAKMAKVEL